MDSIGATPIHQPSSSTNTTTEDSLSTSTTAAAALAAAPAEGAGDGPLSTSSVIAGNGSQFSCSMDRCPHPHQATAMTRPVGNPLMQPPSYAVQAMPYLPPHLFAAFQQYTQVPSTNAAWSRTFPSSSTAANYHMHSRHMMSEPPSFSFGQQPHWYQPMAANAIQPAAATSNDSVFHGHESARGENVAVADGAGAGVEVAAELEHDNELDELDPDQDPRQQGTGNIMDSSFQCIKNFRQEFSPSQLVLKGCSSSLSSHAPKVDIDLMKFWDGEIDRDLLRKAESDTKFWLSKEFYQKETTKPGGRKRTFDTNLGQKLNDELCLDEGFQLSIHTRDTKRSPNFHYIELRCKNLAKPKTKGTGKKKSRAPTEKERCCPFKICVYYHVLHDRFFIRKNSSRHLHHLNHTPLLRSDRNLAANTLSDEDIATVVGLLTKGAPTNMAKLVADILSGNQITTSSMQYLRRGILKNKHGREDGESPAATALRMIRNKQGARCSYMSATKDEANGRLTLFKYNGKVSKRKSKTKGMTQTSASIANAVAESMIDDDFEVTEEVVDLESDEGQYINALLKALEIEDGEILLGLAWSLEEQRRLHCAYPYILGIDVTFGTNAEKRPLLRVTGRNTRNNIFPIAEAFLPSQQRYVFSWFLETALPTILDNGALRKTSLILTDEDIHFIEALLPLIDDKDSPLYRALHRLCKWHKVNRNYQMKVKKYGTTELDKTFVKVVSDWLYSFTNYIESREEEKDSMEKLKAFVRLQKDHPQVSANLVRATIDFIITKFESRLSRLCHRHFLHVVAGDSGDNCWSESSNSSLARDPLGPNPCHHLHVSMDAINEHNEETVGKLRRAAWDELHSTKMETQRESSQQAAARENSDDIIERMNDVVMREFSRSQDEKCCCLEVLVEDGKFARLGQDAEDRKMGCAVRHFLVRTKDLAMGSVDHCRPVYERTRHVTAEEVKIDGKSYICIKCHSCGFFNHNFFCGCRHVYRVLDKLPTKDHFSPCCYKTYEILYGRPEPQNKRYSQACDFRTENLKRYGGVLLEMQLDDISPRQDVILGTGAFDFFLEGYCKLIDCNHNSKELLGGGHGEGSSSAARITPDLSSLQLSSSSKMDPYARFHPLFVSAMDNIRTEEQAKAASEKLHEMFEIVLKIGKDGNSSGSVGPTTEVPVPSAVEESAPDGAGGVPVSSGHRDRVMNSFTNIDTQRQHKRKRPAEERH